jgi:hypothetical protein
MERDPGGGGDVDRRVGARQRLTDLSADSRARRDLCAVCPFYRPRVRARGASVRGSCGVVIDLLNKSHAARPSRWI